MSLDGEQIAANNTAYEMLGYDHDELLGRSFRDIVVPEELPKSENILVQLQAGESVPIYERRFRRKNGETFPVEINVTLVRDRAGEPLHIQSIARDISQRKRDEAALRDAFQQLMKLDDMKSEFINSVSHELRTPITNLKLYHHLLSANPDRTGEYADTLRTQTSRLEEIVEGILFMQTVQQDLTDFSRVPVDITRLLSMAIDKYQQLAQPADIEIVCHATAEDVRLAGDPALLQRALNLLLDNGVKYMSGPGIVAVALEDGADQVLIRITNPTRDLTPEDMNRMFERFYRGHNALTLGVSGAGLGLSIARQIVERHQGALTVQYAPDPETTFTVEMRLPVEAE